MNANIINIFLNSITEILPQLGFQKIERKNIRVNDKIITNNGITVLVGLTKLHGSIAYNMTDKTARSFASTMMNMPVDSLNELAQSAISELVNMITAKAAILLEKENILIDISPPAVIAGEKFTINFCTAKYLILDLLIDSEPLEIDIAIEI